MVQVSDRGWPCHMFKPSTTKDPPYVPSKRAFGFLEKKLEFAASNVACNTMKEAALEIRSNETDTEFSQCGVSVDGTWQRRGYSSLNGCVSVISRDSGKVLDVEFMSKVCRL
ncbi:uncharacterized protein TNCV_528081 [Trichonephila clavipes]|nr:uncharacterized protein TNCV_528081 [Trichonephila clavipes]